MISGFNSKVRSTLYLQTNAAITPASNHSRSERKGSSSSSSSFSSSSVTTNKASAAHSLTFLNQDFPPSSHHPIPSLDHNSLAVLLLLATSVQDLSADQYHNKHTDGTFPTFFVVGKKSRPCSGSGPRLQSLRGWLTNHRAAVLWDRRFVARYFIQSSLVLIVAGG